MNPSEYIFESSKDQRQSSETERLFALFKARNEELAVTVHRAHTIDNAISVIARELNLRGIRECAVSPLSLVDVTRLENHPDIVSTRFITRLSLDEIEKADGGISEFQMGIAETGTLVHDASSVHTRLVTMLPPTHIAILQIPDIVENLEQATDAIIKAYDASIPDYIAFITGQSKTSDIERELTTGVHGPEHVLIVCIG